MDRRSRFLFSLSDQLLNAEEKAMTPLNSDEPTLIDCHTCDATGFYQNDPCAMCDGTGQIDDTLTEEEIRNIKADEKDNDRRGK
jgi:hypothetical protein